jgi:sulfotransferase
MWDMKESCDINCREQLNAIGRFDEVKGELVSAIPDIYYSNVNNKIIFDKCRPWVIPDNITMAQQYISPTIKAIILVRPIDQIIKSFAKIYFNNGADSSVYNELLRDDSEVLMRSFQATLLAALSKDRNHMFISYDKLVERTDDVLSAIYEFIGEDSFSHNIRNVEQTVLEDDTVYGLSGLHDIRQNINKENFDIALPDWVINKSKIMTDILYGELDGENCGLFC